MKIVAGLGLSPLLLTGTSGCVSRSVDGPDDDMGGDGSSGMAETSGSSATTAMSTTSPVTTLPPSDEGTTSVPPEQMCFPSDDWLEWEIWWGVDANGDCVCDQECQMVVQSQWDEENCCGSCWYTFGEVLCSEPLAGQCHFIVTMYEEGCGKGRPLIVNDEARVACVTERDDWQRGDMPRVDGLSPRQRRELAAYWTDAALAEHASVASFARFMLDLSALGAPPELLADTSAAMHDEIRHAQVAFALASGYGGTAVGPGPLPMHGLNAGQSAESIVRAAVREGCVEETLAAAEAELAAHRATEPTVKAALTAIAEDEARHAVLAWRFVDWAVQQDRSLAAAVRDEFDRAIAAAQRASVAPSTDLEPTVAAAHGVLSADARHTLRARCLRGTVAVCAKAMLVDRTDVESASTLA